MPFKPDHEHLAVARAVSGNEKVGDCAVTYAAQPSCPGDCPFIDGGGCYAETGRLGMFVTRPLNEAAARLQATALDVAHAEADAIDALSVPEGRPLRLHSVGDCATDEAARIVAAAAERYMERGGGPVWTYTHAWRTVARASWGRVSVLASCETPDSVRTASGLGYAPSIVVEEFESRRLYTPTKEEANGSGNGRLDDRGADLAGGGGSARGEAVGRQRHRGGGRDDSAALGSAVERAPRSRRSEGAAAGERALETSCRTASVSRPHGLGNTGSPITTGDRLTGQRPGSGDAPDTSVPILPCPAQTHHGTTCSSCRLCFDDEALLERGYAIGFELHGVPMSVRRARLALRTPDDPSRREPLETQLRALLADRPDLTAGEAADELVMSAHYAGLLLAWLRGQAEHPSVLRSRRRRGGNAPRKSPLERRVQTALKRLLAAVDEGRALENPQLRRDVACVLEETARQLRAEEPIAA